MKISSQPCGTTSVQQSSGTKKSDNTQDGYKIQKGDTLYSLSKKFNMSVDEIKNLNGFSGDMLSVGTVIKVPTERFTTTFYSMAKKYNMSVDDLKLLNPQIEDFTRIKAGTVINVPKKPFASDKDTTTPTQPAQNQNNSIVQKSQDESGLKTEVILGNGKVFTRESLQKDANAQADKENRTVRRPLPVVDKGGHIVADVKVYEPTSKNGSLKGKTIIINAGHGGYNPDTGAFDAGTFANDKNGKVIEEWYKNKNFTDAIIPQLQARGAKVIYMSGTAKSVMNAKEKYKNANMFISIHCDSAEDNSKKRGQTIFYNEDTSKKFAQSVETELDKHPWLNSDDCNTQKRTNLGVLKKVSEMPSILIETGYQSNPDDLANIDSSKFRQEFTGLIVKGIETYFKGQ